MLWQGDTAVPRVSNGQPDHRMLFKIKPLVQKAAQRSSYSHACPGASKGEITNKSKLLLMQQQLEIWGPQPGHGQPLHYGELHPEMDLRSP